MLGAHRIPIINCLPLYKVAAGEFNDNMGLFNVGLELAHLHQNVRIVEVKHSCFLLIIIKTLCYRFWPESTPLPN